MEDQSRLTEHIHFRVTRIQKDELVRVAESMEISVGEVLRKATVTLAILFDPELTLGMLIEMAGILKRQV